MPPPPAAREKVLYAYAELLVDGGEGVATLDAVAKRAQVSKGGLLYHFGSKAALADGLADFLGEMVADDVATMRAAPEGAAAYLLRTSHHIDRRFELIYLAAARLAMAGHERSRSAIETAYAAWQDVLIAGGATPATAAIITLLADGLSMRSSFATQAADGSDGSVLGSPGVGFDHVLGVALTLLRDRGRTR